MPFFFVSLQPIPSDYLLNPLQYEIELNKKWDCWVKDGSPLNNERDFAHPPIARRLRDALIKMQAHHCHHPWFYLVSVEKIQACKGVNSRCETKFPCPLHRLHVHNLV